MSAELYPPSPASAPVAVTTTAYKLSVALVMLALAAFAALYLGLIGASVWLLILLFSQDLSYLTIATGLGVVMLLAFLVKELFKRSGMEKDHLLPISEADQPELFAFVRRLCDETKSGFPNGIYVSHEVNAAVFTRTTFLSFFFPRRKNLLIGLGLVNALTLSELKAVLAHEFGHFTQSSTRLGQYVYRANRMVYDMVGARDSWDRLLARWRSVDLRLSFPAWILTAVVWALRKAMDRLAQIVNRTSRSLSREMEFDADALAVRLAGSDAIVSSLWRLERAAVAMDTALRMLSSMADHGCFSDDLFHHHSRAERRFTRWIDTTKEDTPYLRSLRTPYVAGEALHFHEGDDHAPSMWATHPSNRDREVRAKQPYVHAAPVATPAWRLFRKEKELRRNVTVAAYARIFDKHPRAVHLTEASEVEQLGREERDEVKQAAHYHDFYVNRIIDVAEAVQAVVHGGEPIASRETVVPYTGESLAAFVKETSLELENPKLAPMAAQRCRAADEAIFHYFHSVSTGAARETLLERYRFLVLVQMLIVKLLPEERRLERLLDILQSSPELDAATFEDVRQGLAGVSEALCQVWSMSGDVRIPALAHMADNTLVRDFVFPDRPSFAFVGGQVDGKKIGELVAAFGRTVSLLRKLHFKNLGALLKLQENLDPSLYPARTEEDDEDDG